MNRGILTLGLFSILAFIPNTASASVFSGLIAHPAEAQGTSASVPTVLNSQNAPLALASNIGPGMVGGDNKSSSDDVLISDAALAPSMGPAGNAADAADAIDPSGAISFYTVQPGDTVSSVAKMFNITEATLRLANDIGGGQKLVVDSTLVILPHSGLQITVKKGDTVKGLAKKYKIDASEINYANGLTPDSVLVPGDSIMIPDASSDSTADAPTVKKPSPTKKPTTPVVKDTGPISRIHPAKLVAKVDLGDDILRPVDISESRISQFLHGWDRSAVDIAAHKGATVRAPADGTVLYMRRTGYNDGYGMYVILLSNIEGNRVEFIMAHMSEVDVEIGQHVARGEKVGEVGRTGNATGDHLHFEVRGAKQPLTNPRYTGAPIGTVIPQ